MSKLNSFLKKHNISANENISLIHKDWSNKWILTTKEGEQKIDTFYPLYNSITKKMLKDTFCFNGEKGYVGLVSLLDAEIEEVIPIDRVYSGFSHHSRFLSRGGFERVENGESDLFVVINKKVAPYYDANIPIEILKKIESKIKIF